MIDKPIGVSGIDIEIQLVFRSTHIQLVLPYFEKIGLSKSLIDEMINAYVLSGESVPHERWFLEYGQQVFNPLMNEKLGREISHPTFNKMLKHVLKDIIQNDSIFLLVSKANKNNP